jgi:hypothetical protein
MSESYLEDVVNKQYMIDIDSKVNDQSDKLKRMNFLNAEIVNKFYKTLGIMGKSPIISMGKLTK